MPNPRVPCLASGALGGLNWTPMGRGDPAPSILPTVANTGSLLDQRYSMTAALLSRHLVFLASQISWGLHRNLNFFTASCHSLRELPASCHALRELPASWHALRKLPASCHALRKRASWRRTDSATPW